MMTYKSIMGTEYTILSWEGRQLLVKHPGGKVFKLTEDKATELLQSLGIEKDTVPGYVAKFAGFSIIED